MAPRFSWFLCPLLALLLCPDAALSATTPEELDIKTLEKMKEKVKENITGNKQFAVLHLSGKNLEDQDCHEIKFNDARGVKGHCNFAPVLTPPNPLKGNEETVKHSEWQLIHTALRPMLEEWRKSAAGGNAGTKGRYTTKRGKKNKKGGQKKKKKGGKKKKKKNTKGNNTKSGNTKKGNGAKKSCPEALYLYSRLAPDYDCKRRPSGFTCTQAIVNTIPEILRNVNCETTRIVVGFSVVRPPFKAVACEGYDLMKENGIREYHLDSDLPNKEFNCKDASGPTQDKESNSKPCEDMAG
ncbi:uncharacterized protein LOC125046846 [Penaeus chinensis]|uniref:uncharacterized protein LOC125046846 n=1 Tax=Penaeus chinensis TaxID=139456 RepID=UPI001FB72431|nr:uncharacterized protein LOC125046846 [Penaeus chinensis]